MAIKSRLRRLGLLTVAGAAVLGLYVGGYAATFWLCGRGSIGPYDAIKIESTVYLPVLSYRLNP